MCSSAALEIPHYSPHFPADHRHGVLMQHVPNNNAQRGGLLAAKSLYGAHTWVVIFFAACGLIGTLDSVVDFLTGAKSAKLFDATVFFWSKLFSSFGVQVTRADAALWNGCLVVLAVGLTAPDVPAPTGRIRFLTTPILYVVNIALLLVLLLGVSYFGLLQLSPEELAIADKAPPTSLKGLDFEKFSNIEKYGKDIIYVAGSMLLGSIMSGSIRGTFLRFSQVFLGSIGIASLLWMKYVISVALA
jgi:hypothetical protein